MSDSPKREIRPTLRVWEKLSYDHLLAAAHFARSAHDYERQYVPGSGTFPIEAHRACVIGAILTSIACLEAAVNELFAETAEIPNALIRAKDPQVAERLARLWRTGAGRWRVLEKFQVALAAGGKELFDVGGPPFQDARLLIELRNRLVHFKPEWQPASLEDGTQAGELSSLEKRLRGKFVTHPAYKDSGNPFFPDKCLSHGCAEWAVVTATAFCDEFFNRLGIPPPYENFRRGLGTGGSSPARLTSESGP